MRSEDDLFLISPLDQSIPADSEEFLNLVEKQIAQAVQDKDPMKALNICKTLVQAQKISGLVLAKALYLIRQHWEEFSQGEEDFVDVVYEFVGLHRHTVERYLAIWEMFAGDAIPQEYKHDLQQRNIKDLIPIAHAVQQGYDIDEQDWEKLAQAPDFSTVSKIVREEIKGAEPRKGSLVISLSDSTGEIVGFYDGNRYEIGNLNVDDDSDVVEKAINRIVTSSGILRS